MSVFLIAGLSELVRNCFTSRPHVELLLQGLVLTPEESHLIGQLTLLLIAMDEDVGSCLTQEIKAYK